MIFTFWASIIFGGLTLVFRNETFILWKPTIVNWLLSGVLIGSHFLAKKNALQHMLGRQMELHDDVWTRLNFGWACGFFFAGALNLWVAYTFSLDTWVTFRFAGLMGLNILYMISTFAYLYAKGLLTDEHLIDPDAEAKAQDLATDPSADLKESERP